MNTQIWTKPATIERNHFKHKSLSCWSYNVAVGCTHACRFCYVPEVSTVKLAPKLKTYGVSDPDAQWGEYLLVRPWNEHAFQASLKRAEGISDLELNADGNRAVMFCTTTDPYQMVKHEDPEPRKQLQQQLYDLIVGALGHILHNSTLNVRILTRSPLARKDFALMAQFKHRLLFGMSIPTLNNTLARIYEPHAPAPSARLQCLRDAKSAGLNIYAAIAPTYPECDPVDLRRTFEAVAALDPVTIFHEPINIRGENVERIRQEGLKHGIETNTSVFASKLAWANYSIGQFLQVENIALDLGVYDRLHLWPDLAIKGFVPQAWLEKHWNKISAWPRLRSLL